MSIRTLQIEDGPNFRAFALTNGIINDFPSELTFTMDQEVLDTYNGHHEREKDGRRRFQLRLKAIGRAPGDDIDQFVFIGFRFGRESGQKFYVSHYNTRTRKGSCEETSSEEFYGSSHVLRAMFPDLVPK